MVTNDRGGWQHGSMKAQYVLRRSGSGHFGWSLAFSAKRSVQGLFCSDRAITVLAVPSNHCPRSG